MDNKKWVEIEKEDLEKLIQQYKKCKEKLEEREKIIEFLNKQIEEYNRKFTQGYKNDR